MNKEGTNTSIAKIYESYLRPLKEQGVINSIQSVLNGKEYLYYPVNIENENNSTLSILPLTEDCRLILSQPFDEKKVLEDSLETLSRRRSNGGGVKYKIIDTDGSELETQDLLEKYFFNKEYYHTSCAVVLTEFHNNSIEQYSILEDKQTKDVEKEDNAESQANKVENDLTNNNTISATFSTYIYTKEDIEKFFDSDNGQKEEHELVDSICRPLIGKQNYKPFFYYCNEHSKVENINLKSIENHIRLKDPEKHKAKLLDLLAKEKGGAKNQI